MSFEPFGRLPRDRRHRLNVRGTKGSLWFHSTGSHCLTSDYAQDEFDPRLAQVTPSMILTTSSML